MMERTAISWHRGGGELAPLASREAFIAAVAAGAQMVEVDVRMSRDGVLICHHDEHVDGVAICDLLAEGLNLFTFEQFLEDLDQGDPDRTVTVHLDVKATGYELEVVDAITDHGRPFFVTTSERTSLELLRCDRPLVRRYLTIGSAPLRPGRRALLIHRWGELFPTAEISALDVEGIAIHQRLAWGPTRRWCKRHGITVLVWTVDEDQALRKWLDRGVGVITTNRPLRALAIQEIGG